MLRCTRWQARAVSPLFGGGLLSLVTSAGTAIVAVIKGIIDILIDLLSSFEGRILLAAMIVGLSGWYVHCRYTYIERDSLDGLQAQVAQLTRQHDQDKANLTALLTKPTRCRRRSRPATIRWQRCPSAPPPVRSSRSRRWLSRTWPLSH